MLRSFWGRRPFKRSSVACVANPERSRNSYSALRDTDSLTESSRRGVAGILFQFGRWRWVHCTVKVSDLNLSKSMSDCEDV